VTDATVTIRYGSDIDTLLSLGNGFYGGVFIEFEPGLDYTLDVESETLGHVTSTTQAKPKISFRDLAAELYYDNFDDTLAQVTYRLDDPREEKNWYMLNVFKVDREELRDNVLNPREYIRLKDDLEFNGRQYIEAFRVFPREFSSGDTLAIYLSNISEEYFDFIQLRLDNRFSLVEFISEPLNYPSNVEGGKGYFNLYIPDIRFIVLRQ
jgi:hypothetical protein